MRTIDHAIDRLKDAIRCGNLETAGFGELLGPYPVVIKDRHEADAYVKGQIELWLNSWLVGPMREAVAILEQHREIVDASRALNDQLFRDDALSKAIARLHMALEAGKRFD